MHQSHFVVGSRLWSVDTLRVLLHLHKVFNVDIPVRFDKVTEANG